MKPQPRERRSSLAAVQKTLDSILEESEHGSSTKRSNIESSDSCDEDSETVSELTDEDDFDSDCSEVSEEQLNTEEILYQFAMDTDELIIKEQESILKEFLQNNSDQDLPQLTQNLERLNSEIGNIDSLIQAKDKILEEAAQSSLELKQAKNQLESKLSEICSSLQILPPTFQIPSPALQILPGGRGISCGQWETVWCGDAPPPG